MKCFLPVFAVRLYAYFFYEHDDEDFENFQSFIRVGFYITYGCITYANFKLFPVPIKECLEVGVVNINMLNYFGIILCAIFPTFLCLLTYAFLPTLFIVIPVLLYQCWKEWRLNQALEQNKQMLPKMLISEN